MQSLMVLGRQPELGLAELESLYGADKLRPVGSKVAIVDVDPCLLAFDRLGGSVKFCKVLTELKTTSWREVEKFLLKTAPRQAQKVPAGKLQLGLSAIDWPVSTKQLEATGLSLKKAIRDTGRSVRLVPNKEPELNAAQVIHNHLAGENGWELVLIKNGNETIIAQTVKVQDIASYTLRDRDRPKRDAKVGMLPPKLAQIIINLAAGKLPEDKLKSICEIPAGEKIPAPNLHQSILDPFCGTGVILQEALLMGYDAYGSDLEQRMVDYSKVNVMEWLPDQYELNAKAAVEKADATSASWELFPKIDFVASETYLGRPFISPPEPEVLMQTISECNLIIKKFLKNACSQLRPGTRFCLAVPAWQMKPEEFKHLPLVDQLNSLGYNRIRFEHVSGQLLYYREGQIVARELLVLIRK